METSYLNDFPHVERVVVVIYIFEFSLYIIP